MAGSETREDYRMPPVLVVGGLTLGILILFGLQFVIPYFLGPWGLVVVGMLDLLIFLEARHRKRGRKKPRRASLIEWGAVDRRYISHAQHPLEREVALTFVLIAFVLGLYVLGLVLRIESWWLTTNLNLYIVGSVMTAIAVWLVSAFFWQSVWLQSESEKYDTTEDH